MSNSVSVSLVAIAMLGVGIVSIPTDDKDAIAATPFWQMHGAAPSATETGAIAQLRLTARQVDDPVGDHVVVALQDR